MQYDIERSPGRTHETQPQDSGTPHDPSQTAAMGGMAMAMVETTEQNASDRTTAMGGMATAMAQGASDHSASATTGESSDVASLTGQAAGLASTTQEGRAAAASAEATSLAMSGAEVRAQTPGLTSPRVSGGNMSLGDTIAQVASLQQSIDDQTRLINNFLKENSETIQLVRTHIKGSRKSYDQLMETALTQAESSLKASQSALQQASTALTRVQEI